jgi:hypothetical protein
MLDACMLTRHGMPILQAQLMDIDGDVEHKRLRDDGGISSSEDGEQQAEVSPGSRRWSSSSSSSSSGCRSGNSSGNSGHMMTVSVKLSISELKCTLQLSRW